MTSVSLSSARAKEHTGNQTFEDLLKEKGYLVYKAQGNSMMPFIHPHRDIIEIRPIQGKVKKYEVALYKRGSTYVLHRCLSSSPYIFAGDHNTFIEKDITDDMILGIVTRVIRNGKTITPDNFWYKIYVYLWCDCYPVRMWIIRTRQRVWSILSRIKHKVFK